MTKQQTVEWVKSECKKYGVTCQLPKTNYVKTENGACTGYYHPDLKIIRVAAKSEWFIEVLIHEFCHVLQHMENGPIWKNSHKAGWIVNGWLNGIDYGPNIGRCISQVRDMELDNEKRAVKLIKQLGIECVDVKLYIRKANAYIQFYNWVLLTRSWSKPNKPMYSSKTVVSLCPETLSMNYNKLPKKLGKAMTDFQNGLVP